MIFIIAPVVKEAMAQSCAGKGSGKYIQEQLIQEFYIEMLCTKNFFQNEISANKSQSKHQRIVTQANNAAIKYLWINIPVYKQHHDKSKIIYATKLHFVYF